MQRVLGIRHSGDRPKLIGCQRGLRCRNISPGSFTRLAGFRLLSQSFDSACSNIALIALGMWVAH
jgi:hypothetical protein